MNKTLPFKNFKILMQRKYVPIICFSTVSYDLIISDLTFTWKTPIFAIPFLIYFVKISHKAFNGLNITAWTLQIELGLTHFFLSLYISQSFEMYIRHSNKICIKLFGWFREMQADVSVSFLVKSNPCYLWWRYFWI